MDVKVGVVADGEISYEGTLTLRDGDYATIRYLSDGIADALELVSRILPESGAVTHYKEYEKEYE